MCGIIAYIGHKKAEPILIQALKRLEYRGYDSAGITTLEKSGFKQTKSVGKIDSLQKKIKNNDFSGTMGIGHTRWATHGGVTEKNAHPHTSSNGFIVLAHNGIIENYKELKKWLGPKYKYQSETDTEVLANLIEFFYTKKTKKSLLAAVKQALEKVRGTYGIAVMAKDDPETLISARMGSPIVIGIGKDDYYVASDPTPILPYTHKMMFLDDGDLVEIKRDSIETFSHAKGRVQKKVEEIEYDATEAEKKNFKHFMLKEIMDQSEVFKDAIRGRIDLEEGAAVLGGINMNEQELRNVDRIVFIACGTAMHASMIGKYVIEKLAGIPVEVDVASEFRYRDPVINTRTLVFAVSQSGETADTLAAVREAKRRGAYVRGIVNVVGSTIARETGGGTYIHAGPELAVASTKAYTNMVTVMTLYALYLGRLRGMNITDGQEIIREMEKIPSKMKKIFKQNEKIKRMASIYKKYSDFLYLGRGLNYPVALEGSLKLKEISYIHSEGYAAGEMKHGANALLSPECPVVAIVTKNSLYDKMRSNIEEVKARKSRVLAIATERDKGIKDLADDIIFVPKTHEFLEPILNSIPLQIFAYHVARLLGNDVDRPRNLAKSVTVE